MATREQLIAAIGNVRLYVHAIYDTAATLKEDDRDLRIRTQPDSSPWPAQPDINTSSCCPFDPGGCELQSWTTNPGFFTVDDFLKVIKSLDRALGGIEKAMHDIPAA